MTVELHNDCKPERDLNANLHLHNVNVLEISHKEVDLDFRRTHVLICKRSVNFLCQTDSIDENVVQK